MTKMSKYELELRDKFACIVLQHFLKIQCVKSAEEFINMCAYDNVYEISNAMIQNRGNYNEYGRSYTRDT